MLPTPLASVSGAPDPLFYTACSFEQFVDTMLGLGPFIEMSIVSPVNTEGRGSLRDIPLPIHRDGEYSGQLAAAQGDTYVERPGIRYVGMYGIREGEYPCGTTVEFSGQTKTIYLKAGQALILDNQRVLHGRLGKAGPSRLLIRMWIGEENIQQGDGS